MRAAFRDRQKLRGGCGGRGSLRRGRTAAGDAGPCSHGQRRHLWTPASEALTTTLREGNKSDRRATSLESLDARTRRMDGAE